MKITPPPALIPLAKQPARRRVNTFSWNSFTYYIWNCTNRKGTLDIRRGDIEMVHNHSHACPILGRALLCAPLLRCNRWAQVFVVKAMRTRCMAPFTGRCTGWPDLPSLHCHTFAWPALGSLSWPLWLLPTSQWPGVPLHWWSGPMV